MMTFDRSLLYRSRADVAERGPTATEIRLEAGDS